MDANHYTYRVAWSPEDDAFVATVVEFPSLSWVAAKQAAALTGIRKLVAGVLEDMAGTDETPPEPIALRRYSGQFRVRVPEPLHRRLAREAAEQGVSLNQLVVSRLAGS